MCVGLHSSPGMVICRLPGGDGDFSFGVFRNPCEVIEAGSLCELPDAMARLEAVSAEGKYAAGFISYESAPFFDPACRVKTVAGFPLLWFGVYDEAPDIFDSSGIESDTFEIHFEGVPEVIRDEYLSMVGRALDYIRDGDIYQVNYTFRSEMCWRNAGQTPHPLNIFLGLFRSHPVPYAAYVDTGSVQLASLSPELFIERRGNGVRSLPMKGTSRRRLNPIDDFNAAKALSRDPKNRAENIMIVDMVRNDLGRVCDFGSVETGPLCRVDTYRTVHQMVSEVRGNLREGTGIGEILHATFPAASITGAPKIRAMQIIEDLENSPRKVYTGSIGCMLPGGDFCLNVAIRTLLFDRGRVELGIGSGIVADSIAADEWEECLLKSRFVSCPPYPRFELLETILWDGCASGADARPISGYRYLDKHLDRLRNSQRYFGWKTDDARLHAELDKAASGFPKGSMARVRLRISQACSVSIDHAELKSCGWGSGVKKLKIASQRTDSQNVFFYHKTTRRELYDTCFKQAQTEGFDEVLFFNEEGCLTEGAISNVFICRSGRWATPPVSCGLLDGIWRASKKVELSAVEECIGMDDLLDADKIVIGNSVRGDAEGVLYPVP
ncbi:MAG: aminodeoxychorismate synthase component I [Victivallales bacterium]|nr:aminodeoxychorismate synthase component I [Victivallales bacterium]